MCGDESQLILRSAVKATDWSLECTPPSHSHWQTPGPKRQGDSRRATGASTTARPIPPSRAAYGDTSGVARRLTSNHFVGRRAELDELLVAARAATSGQPALVLLGGESGVGKTPAVGELERLLRPDGCSSLRGEAVEQEDGELPYAPMTSALRPLVRRRDPALDELGRGSRAQLAALLPGLDDAAARPTGTIPPPRCGCSRRCSSSSTSLSERLAGGADPRGPALGRSLDPHVRLVSRAQPAPGAGARASSPTARTSSTAVIRCARCSQSSSGSSTCGRSSSQPFSRDELAEVLADILGDARRDARRPAVCAQRGQRAVHRGAARGGSRRSRRRPAEPARRVHAPDRAAVRATRSVPPARSPSGGALEEP